MNTNKGSCNTNTDDVGCALAVLNTMMSMSTSHTGEAIIRHDVTNRDHPNQPTLSGRVN